MIKAASYKQELQYCTSACTYHVYSLLSMLHPLLVCDEEERQLNQEIALKWTRYECTLLQISCVYTGVVQAHNKIAEEHTTTY